MRHVTDEIHLDASLDVAEAYRERFGFLSDLWERAREEILSPACDSRSCSGTCQRACDLRATASALIY